MDLLSAHEAFTRIDPAEREELLPVAATLDLPGGRLDVWAACATAAVAISGGLAACENEGMLREALGYFRTLLDLDQIDAEEWRVQTALTVEAVVEAFRLCEATPTERAALASYATSWN